MEAQYKILGNEDIEQPAFTRALYLFQTVLLVNSNTTSDLFLLLQLSVLPAHNFS